MAIDDDLSKLPEGKKAEEPVKVVSAPKDDNATIIALRHYFKGIGAHNGFERYLKYIKLDEKFNATAILEENDFTEIVCAQNKSLGDLLKTTNLKDNIEYPVIIDAFRYHGASQYILQYLRDDTEVFKDISSRTFVLEGHHPLALFVPDLHKDKVIRFADIPKNNPRIMLGEINNRFYIDTSYLVPSPDDLKAYCDLTGDKDTSAMIAMFEMLEARIDMIRNEIGAGGFTMKEAEGLLKKRLYKFLNDNTPDLCRKQ